jgi:hypothetical protein
MTIYCELKGLARRSWSADLFWGGVLWSLSKPGMYTNVRYRGRCN